jgi:hypothetical protein
MSDPGDAAAEWDALDIGCALASREVMKRLEHLSRLNWREFVLSGFSLTVLCGINPGSGRLGLGLLLLVLSAIQWASMRTIYPVQVPGQAGLSHTSSIWLARLGCHTHS